METLFSTTGVKGTRKYLDSQKKYEIIRTIVYFAISLSLFTAGFVTTGTRNNLLTIVAVLGCLPASKSLVEAIMYCKYHSLSDSDYNLIEPCTGELSCLYDLVFTTREKTYPVPHLAVVGNTVAGYLPDPKLSPTDCAKHLETCLKRINIPASRSSCIRTSRSIRSGWSSLESFQQMKSSPPEFQIR